MFYAITWYLKLIIFYYQTKIDCMKIIIQIYNYHYNTKK